LCEGGVTSVDGRSCAHVAFRARPDLGLTDEPAQLLEQHLGGSVVPLELLDPVEPIDDGAGFVHVATVARQNARIRLESVTGLCRSGGVDAVMAVFGAPAAKRTPTRLQARA